MTMIFELPKASPIGDESVEDLTLVFEVPIEFNDLVSQREAYNDYGMKIVEALFNHLPGGLIDAMLVEMMSRRASLFRVKL